MHRMQGIAQRCSLLQVQALISAELEDQVAAAGKQQSTSSSAFQVLCLEVACSRLVAAFETPELA